MRIKKIYFSKKTITMLMAAFLAILFICLTPLIVKAKSGYNYNPNQNITASTALPWWTHIDINVSEETISYGIEAKIDGGSTGGETFRYYVYPKLWLENPSSGGEIELEVGSTMNVAMNGGVGTSDTDSGSLSFSKSQIASMIDMNTYSPSISSSGLTSNYMCYASASGGSKRGTAELELCLYLDDWYGPGDNCFPPICNDKTYGVAPSMRITKDDRYFNINFSETDPIRYYCYTYDTSPYNYTVSNGNSGYGSTFSDYPTPREYTQYCHVTFYTESGEDCSTVIEVPPAHKINYHLNRGTGNIPSSSLAFPGNSLRITTQTPSYTNYEFLGWSKQQLKPLGYGVNPASVTTVYNPGSYITIGSSNVDLYAIWRTIKVPYNITSTLNGVSYSDLGDYGLVTGTCSVSSFNVTNARKFSCLAVPGYTVSATVKSSDPAVFIMNSGNPGHKTMEDYILKIPSKKITGATTDTVNFGTIHTVKYNANGGVYAQGNAGPPEQTKYYGTDITVSSNIPTRKGYEFTGWKSNITGTVYQPGNKYSYSMRGGEDVLYAQWKPITYTVKFDKNTPAGAKPTDITGTMSNISCTYDVIQALPKNNYVFGNCDFQGWNTEPDGSGVQFKDREAFSNLTDVKGATVTLYAQWKVTYHITGTLNNVPAKNGDLGDFGLATGKIIDVDSVEPYKNGDVTGDGHLKEEDAEAIKSYINGNKNFTVKQIAAMDINGDKSVTDADYKKCKELIAKLTTDITDSSKFTHIALPGYTIEATVRCATDDVYIMKGNNHSSKFKTAIKKKTINSTVTDIVHFGTIHTVAFDPNKEPGSSEVHGTPESITKYFNVPIKVPEAPYRDGYDFTGYKSDTTDKTYQPGDTYDVAESLPENKYKLAGWKFVGWNTEPDGSGRHFDEISDDSVSDAYKIIILYIDKIMNLSDISTCLFFNLLYLVP